VSGAGRDRDAAGRARNARPRDRLGRPLCATDHDDVAKPDAPALPPAEALRRAQVLLDDGRPFEAHEVLEAVWKSVAEPDRGLWRGLAQLAVGITHALRGNDSGARALLTRSSQSLSPYAGTTPAGVDVDGLRAWADHAATDLSLVEHPPQLKP
jgi:hypothetical protein